jgi:hypothetical protein
MRNPVRITEGMDVGSVRPAGVADIFSSLLLIATDGRPESEVHTYVVDMLRGMNSGDVL